MCHNVQHNNCHNMCHTVQHNNCHNVQHNNENNNCISNIIIDGCVNSFKYHDNKIILTDKANIYVYDILTRQKCILINNVFSYIIPKLQYCCNNISCFKIIKFLYMNNQLDLFISHECCNNNYLIIAKINIDINNFKFDEKINITSFYNINKIFKSHHNKHKKTKINIKNICYDYKNNKIVMIIVCNNKSYVIYINYYKYSHSYGNIIFSIKNNNKTVKINDKITSIDYICNNFYLLMSNKKIYIMSILYDI